MGTLCGRSVDSSFWTISGASKDCVLFRRRSWLTASCLVLAVCDAVQRPSCRPRLRAGWRPPARLWKMLSLHRLSMTGLGLSWIRLLIRSTQPGRFHNSAHLRYGMCRRRREKLRSVNPLACAFWCSHLCIVQLKDVQRFVQLLTSRDLDEALRAASAAQLSRILVRRDPTQCEGLTLPVFSESELNFDPS